MSASQTLNAKDVDDRKAADHHTVCQVVEQYFTCLNQQQFDQMASLFADDGKMYPPFDGAIVGNEAIERYLRKSATDMSANPQQWEVVQTAEGDWKVNVTGKVTAIVFKVRVNWHFDITSAGEISAARIKLLASPKELLNLRSVAPQEVPSMS